MERGQQILSLWIGPESQKSAHHFYSLQAEQFYDPLEDPTNQNALWTFKDKYMEEKQPRMIIFDTESTHLSKIRRVNHKKLIKEMSKPSNSNSYFPFQYMPQEKEQQQEQQFNPQTFLYENWQASQQNYVLIDKKFNEERVSYELWQNLFNYFSDQYEDPIRKLLQKSDYLNVFSLCSDAEKLGITSKIIEYLKDQCPKKSQILVTLSNQKTENYFNQCFLPLIGEIAEQVSIMADISIQKPKFAYFQGQIFYHQISPILNSFYTPFILKNSNSNDYIQKIKNNNKSIFNMAYTLPIIDQSLSLSHQTNILEYFPSISKKTNKPEITQETNRINFTNTNFLSYDEKTHGNKGFNFKSQKVNLFSSNILSQSFVLKGQFNEMMDWFHKKNSKTQIRYLQGILSTNPHLNLKYDKFYQKQYQNDVQNYPFHTVLFQHGDFGPSLRNYIRSRYTGKIGNQMMSQWHEHSLQQADLYSQQLGEDSD